MLTIIPCIQGAEREAPGDELSSLLHRSAGQAPPGVHTRREIHKRKLVSSVQCLKLEMQALLACFYMVYEFRMVLHFEMLGKKIHK